MMTAAAGSRTRIADSILLCAMIVFSSTVVGTDIWTPENMILLASVCAVAFLGGLWYYRRPVGETLGEWPLRIMYRMRVVAPGLARLPRTGPVLVIANHTAFFDPCWIMIRLPRDLTPVMYGEYFIRPGLHFYMKHIINAIPSGVGTIRRETPELDEAVRRLDRGEGVLIFPEGWVRRKADEGVRRFAQGAWRILRERPTTPVVACWIEGGWGTWTSFAKGRPFKGWPDFRRRINIGVAAPVVLDAETLGDQHKTRELLREMVIDAKKHVTARG
jgi:1-acyl-sn-glycerol-3-phosphate acyltransferase